MFDSIIHKVMDRPLHIVGKSIHALGISANSITLIGFFFGIVSILCIATDNLQQGLLFFFLNRVCDGLDGSVARLQTKTDRGEFLDIVCDFFIYAGMVFAFVVSHPDDGIWGIFLIFSFMGAAASSLAYAIIASKSGRVMSAKDNKSGGTEAVMALSLMFFFPDIFEFIALGYGLLCWATTGERIIRAWIDFGQSGTEKTRL